MDLITKQALLTRLPQTWAAQYDKTTLGIYDTLVSEPNLTAARAAEIIGNDSWTRITCDECKMDCEVAVSVGEEADYESSTATICLPCLQKAVALALASGK